MRFLPVFLSLISVALAIPRTRLDLNHKGAQCYYLDQYGSRNASVALKVNELIYTDGEVPADYAIPFLIFKYTEFEHAYLPSAKTYVQSYVDSKSALYEQVIDPNTNGFKLTFKADAPTPALDTFDTGFLALDEEHVFNAPSLGFYCVYIAPPITDNLQDLTVSLSFKNSHGSLPFFDYITYQNRKVAILVGTGIFAYLLHYIIKFKVSSDYRNFDSISIISKSVILYVLFPIVVLNAIQCFTAFLENFVSSESSVNNIFQFLNWGNVWLSTVFDSTFSLFVLLLSMGYGVMYDNIANLRLPLPPSQWRIAKYLFAGSLVVRTLMVLSYMASPIESIFVINDLGQLSPLPMEGSYPSENMLNLSVYFVGASGLIQLAWFVMTMTYYIRTRKVLAHFAPVSDAPSSDTLEKNERIIKAFRRSILVIFVLPVFIGFLAVFVLVWMLVHSKAAQIPVSAPTDTMRLSVAQVLYSETFLSSGVAAINIWSTWLYIFVGVALIFGIWIKDNNGLLVNEQTSSTTAYSDESRFVVDSD